VKTAQEDALDRSCNEFEKTLRSVDFLRKRIEASGEDCPVCMDDLDGDLAVCVTPCGHLFHEACLRQTCLTSGDKCPTCRGTLRANEADMYAVPKKSVAAKNGSKIQAIMEAMASILKKDAGAKVLVFVQFNPFKEKLLEAMRAFELPGIEMPDILVLQGNVHQKSRTTKNFKEGVGSKVMVLSMESDSSGMNLFEASHVFLTHPFIADSAEKAGFIELQAVCRALRPRQKKRVCVWKFIVKETIEEDLHMQRIDKESEQPAKKAKKALPPDEAGVVKYFRIVFSFLVHK